MAPLVSYGSSDDDEDEVQPRDAPASAPQQKPKEPAAQQSEDKTLMEKEAHNSPPPPPPPPQSQPNAEKPGPSSQIGPTLPPSAATMGPSPPPADEAEAYPEQMDEDLDLDRETQGDQGQTPLSPYSANRALLHQLTLPTVPDLDIPPSPPPGSPSSDARHAALTAKFDRFLELKRKKGVHFNARIADSHAFRNPEQTDKLLGFVGIETKFDRDHGAAAGQYATTLPTDLWDPAGFPEWAYRGQLRRAQDKVAKERARAQGEAVKFVPAADT